jgi:hypothetical protein
VRLFQRFLAVRTLIGVIVSFLDVWAYGCIALMDRGVRAGSGFAGGLLPAGRVVRAAADPPTWIPGRCPSSTTVYRHQPTLIAAARSQTTASSSRGTFSQAELTADRVITRFWAIHLSGPDENRPLDAVVMAARRTKILRLVRLTEYP